MNQLQIASLIQRIAQLESQVNHLTQELETLQRQHNEAPKITVKVTAPPEAKSKKGKK